MWLCCSKHYFIGQWHALLRAPGAAEGLERVTLPSPLCSRPSIDVLRGYFSRRGAAPDNGSLRLARRLLLWEIGAGEGAAAIATITAEATDLGSFPFDLVQLFVAGGLGETKARTQAKHATRASQAAGGRPRSEQAAALAKARRHAAQMLATARKSAAGGDVDDEGIDLEAALGEIIEADGTGAAQDDVEPATAESAAPAAPAAADLGPAATVAAPSGAPAAAAVPASSGASSSSSAAMGDTDAVPVRPIRLEAVEGKHQHHHIKCSVIY